MKGSNYFLCLQLLRALCSIHGGDEVLVKVEQGLLRGERVETVTGEGDYKSFKGIPYAKPPLGKLRFKTPQPPLCWNGVRNATKHGSICKQVDAPNSSEDCLFLNVYTPNICPDDLLAVMVFIPGGSYLYGSGNVDIYGPDFLVNEGVVVVTVNSRLGSLGFLCMDTEEVPGNAGLKDQHAALVWVHNNIAAFGGNPKNVTLFGQSSGAAAVGYHVLSPKSKGLFQRVILMSGVPYCDFSIPFESRRRAFVLGKLLGFETENECELLEFLQSIDSEKLVGTTPTVLAFEDQIIKVPKIYSFVPVVEKRFSTDNFLVKEPSVILNNEDINDVDVMFGYTNAEGLASIALSEEYILDRYNKYPEMLAPGKILFNNAPKTILKVSDKIHKFYFRNLTISKYSMKEFINYANNVTLVYDVQRFFSRFPRCKQNKMYFYIFSGVTERNVFAKMGAKFGVKGAAHLDDLMHLFEAKAFNLPIAKNSKEYAMVKRMTAVFTNFAKFGNPTPDKSLGITWPEFDNVTLSYVDIGDNLTISSAPDKADVAFWKTILEYAGIPF